MIYQFKEQKALAVAAMRGMVEKAPSEKRNLSDDEVGKFARGRGGMNRHPERIVKVILDFV